MPFLGLTRRGLTLDMSGIWRSKFRASGRSGSELSAILANSRSIMGGAVAEGAAAAAVTVRSALLAWTPSACA